MLPTHLPGSLPSKNAFKRDSRTAGWEARLAAVLKEASTRKYNARNWNCAKFAHASAEAVTGRTLPYQLRSTLAKSVDALFQRHPDAKLARRGDTVLANLPEGPTLGVCVGDAVAFVMQRGLMNRPRSVVSIAWRTE